MGDKKFTLVELHLDGDTQFGPKTIADALPIGGKTGEETAIETREEEEDAAAVDDDSGGRSAIGVVVALVVLVGIAVAVRKFRGSEEEETLEEREEPDVVVS